jgi:sugar lactone lactonase YvrE
MKSLLVIQALLLGVPAAFAEGVVSGLSGENGNAGHQDGTGSAAIFNDPMGLARDADGNLFVCDARNHVIRKISTLGVVTTLAGEPGEEGAVDGVGSDARFRFPADIAVSPEGVLFVADSGNHCIRVVQTDGTVSTLAGDLGNADDIDVDYGNEAFTPVAQDLDGTGAEARFNSPGGIAYSAEGLLYVSDTGNHIIRSVDPDGVVITVAGKAGEWASTDGTGQAARFDSPMGLCFGSGGNLYIADSGNHSIRCMDADGAVTTFSGNASEFGFQTGSRLDARYRAPSDITPHPEGGFVICEAFGNVIFRVDGSGNVSVLSGDGNPTPQQKTLSRPSSAVCDDLGNVYVADTFNQEVVLVIEKFEMSVSMIDGTNQFTITWDSLPGRDYRLQILGDEGWENAPGEIITATSESASISFPIPANQPKGIYRILLLGY